MLIKIKKLKYFNSPAFSFADESLSKNSFITYFPPVRGEVIRKRKVF